MIKIKAGISARHFHISKETLKILFGKNYELTILKPLSQPNQYAAEETIKIIGNKDSFNKVRILGPIRLKDQLELSITDCIKIGILPVLRESGNIIKTPGIKLVGPNGSFQMKEGVIVASRHVHLNDKFAKKNNIIDGQIIKIKTEGKRSLIFNNVKVRVSKFFLEEFHIDTDEANAGFISNEDFVTLII